MPTQRADWYNLHSSRRYPLADSATGSGDNGERLPDDILLDLHIRFPSTLGRYAFIGGLTVSSKLVSLVLLAADQADQTTNFTPLAAVTLARSAVRENVSVPLTPLQAGVGGFVVFGDVSENFVGRFSQPHQTLLTPRTARAYQPLPVHTLRKEGRANGLHGLINIRAGTDLEIVREPREIDGIGFVNALVLRLKQSPNQPNILARYIGPCDTRPESRNCIREGIETVNEVRPDCDGNINLCFRNMESYPYPDGGGEVLELPVGLSQVCPTRTTERFRGEDLCNPSSSSSSGTWIEISSASSVEVSESLSSSSLDCASLPYCQNFDDQEPGYFVALSGEWGFDPFDSPYERCPVSSSSCFIESSLSSWFSSSSASLVPQTTTILQEVCEPYVVDVPWSYVCRALYQRNVAVWDGCAYSSSLYKRISTDLQILDGAPQQNGGIIINYHQVDLLTNPRIEYFHAVLDRLNHEVQLWRFTGVAPIIKINAIALGQPVVPEHWYRMVVEVEPLTGLTVNIRVTVSGVTDPGWSAILLNTPTNKYLPADGLFGLGSNLAYTRFSYFHIEEIV